MTCQMSALDACDAAIAELFFACNITPSIADHPKFKKVVNVLKTAPASYEAPNRKRLLGPLLNTTVDRICARLQPLRETMARDCVTIISDGWDTIERDHLINLLYGNASCMFFDGTVQLTSDDGESADFVAELIRQCIERVGRFAFVQVCTDTCAVMQVCSASSDLSRPILTHVCCLAVCFEFGLLAHMSYHHSRSSFTFIAHIHCSHSLLMRCVSVLSV